MPGDIGVHEFADDLCRRLVLRPARFYKAIAKIALNSDAKARILGHGVV
jgi:hypothetical protein